MSKEIFDAILKIRKAVPSIKHDADNKHDSYTYVSIDRYYAGVASVISQHGLVWRTRQVGFELMDGQGKGRDRVYVRATFAYDLYMGDTKIEDYMTVPIIAPLTGAQTTGTVFSYAEKVFMRVAFCVATGEEDADHGQQEKGGVPDSFLPDKPTPTEVVRQMANGSGLTDPAPQTQVKPMISVMGPAGTQHYDGITGEQIPEPDPPPMMTADELQLAPNFADGLPIIDTRRINEEAAETIEHIFKTFMPKVKSVMKLREWHTENLAAREKVLKVAPEVGKRISQMFADKNKELGKK